MKRKGFTLVELLVVIVILGIIAGISIPLIRNLTVAFDKRKYESYSDSVLYAAKLYNDSYSEDLFGHNENGCCYIKYSNLQEKNLIKDIEVEGMSCNSSMTYVKVNKQKDKYSFIPYISCGKKVNGRAGKISFTYPEEVPEIDEIECSCTNIPNLKVYIDPEDATEAGEEVKKSVKKTKISIASGTGINTKVVLYAKWSKTWNDYTNENGEFKKIDFTVIDNQEEVLAKEGRVQIKSKEILTPPADGEYYLIARIDYLEDLYGNKWRNPDENNPDSQFVTLTPQFIIEGYEEKGNIALKIENKSKGKWVNHDIKLDVTANAWVPITRFEWTTNANNAVWDQIEDVPLSNQTYDEEEEMYTLGFSRTYSGETQNNELFIKACDRDLNCITKSTWVRIDKIPPEIVQVKNSSNGNWTNKDVELIIKAKDIHSGLEGYYYSYKSDATEKGVDDPENGWVLLPSEEMNKKCITSPSVNECAIKTISINDGKVLDKTVYIRIYDKAGNYVDTTTVVKIDKTKPTKPTINNPKNNEWTNNKITVKISTTDTGSGINRYYYSTNKTKWYNLDEDCGKDISKKKAILSNTCNSVWKSERDDTVYIKACDLVGNCSDYNSTKIRIDTTAPTCKANKDSKTTGKTTGVTVTFTCYDNKGGSGLKSECETKKTKVKKTTSYKTLYDNAGNSKVCKVTVESKCSGLKCKSSEWERINNYYWNCKLYPTGKTNWTGDCVMSAKNCKKYALKDGGYLYHWYEFKDCSQYYGKPVTDKCKSLNKAQKGVYCWGFCGAGGYGIDYILNPIYSGRDYGYKGYGLCEVCMEAICNGTYTYS